MIFYILIQWSFHDCWIQIDELIKGEEDSNQRTTRTTNVKDRIVVQDTDNTVNRSDRMTNEIDRMLHSSDYTVNGNDKTFTGAYTTVIEKHNTMKVN